MKKILIVFILFLSNNLFAQVDTVVVPMVDKKVIYSDVVMVDSNSRDILYGKAKLWFANAFNSSKDVIQLDDKEGGIILGKGNITEEGTSALIRETKTWKFTVKIQVKDNKYKAEIYDITYIYDQPGERSYGLPAYWIFNECFNDKVNFKSDGTPRNKITHIGEDANVVIKSLLRKIRKAMKQELKSDF